MPKTMQDNVILHIDDLHVSFRQEWRTTYAVNGVTLSIHKGETLGIVGESGCGKSVTAQSIVRLVPCPPGQIDKGSILIRCGDTIVDSTKIRSSGKEIRNVRGRYVSVIFQEPMRSLHPMHSIGWQIIEGLSQHMQVTRGEAKQQALDLLYQVGLPEPIRVFHEFPHQLSGGMRQRVMIAIACACNPQLLIADEPTTALDVTIQAQILSLLKSIQAKRGMSMLLITHDLGVIAEMADRVAVMYLGKIVEMAPAKKLFANPMHPYTKGLMDSVPLLSTKPKTKLKSLPGTVRSSGQPPVGCVFANRCGSAMDVCTIQAPPCCQHEDHEVYCWLYEEQ